MITKSYHVVIMLQIENKQVNEAKLMELVAT